MTDDKARIIQAARQLIETDQLFGGQFMPAGRSELPAAKPATSAPAGTTRQEKAEALAALTEEVQGCTRCALAAGRTQTVFGEGDPDADLVFVGEAPGVEEDATGRPFVGRAGELLTKMIKAMGLSRQNVYICNMLKCRPPGNRTPNPQEIECCWDFLIRQLQILQPEVIVTLGNPSTKGLLGTREGITRIRGRWQKLPLIGEGLVGIDVMPTFHPAYLLRQYTPDNRAKVWSDLREVMRQLGLEQPRSTGRQGP